MPGHNSLIFICFLWFTLLESPSGMSKGGYYVGEQTVVSGHLTGTFVFQTAASCLVTVIIKYKRHILFSLMFRCVKFSVTVYSRIYSRRKLPYPVSLEAKLDVL